MSDELSRIVRLEEQGKNIVEKLDENNNQHSEMCKKLDILTEVHIETRGYINGVKNALYILALTLAAVISAVAWLTDKAIQIHSQYLKGHL